MMKNTKTAAVPTVVIDAKTIEAIVYNNAATAQIQPSMSEPADVSLPLPSSDPLLMKDTKTAAVPRVRIDAKTIEAIVYNRAAKPQIQTSSMSESADGADGADDHPSALRRPGPSIPPLRGHVRRKLG